MAEYLPFNEKNSIQEAQINLLFVGQFDQQSIESTRDYAQAELSEALPHMSEVRGGSLQINMSNPGPPVPLRTMSSDLVGFQLSAVQRNAQPSRVLRLANNSLSLSIMDYESWPTTRKVVSEFLEPVLSSLGLPENPVIAFGLRFIDRYTFSGRPDDARAGLLFIQKNPYITPYTFESGSAWHCNTGWFDFSLRDRVLHNLNVASNLVDLSSTVTIDHSATMNLASPLNSTTALFHPQNDSLGFINVLDILHKENKDILRKALLPEMLDKIGLAL